MITVSYHSNYNAFEGKVVIKSIEENFLELETSVGRVGGVHRIPGQNNKRKIVTHKHPGNSN